MLTTLKALKKLSQNLSILYVEDDLVLRERTQSVLENLFDTVSTAVDGIDGLKNYKHYYETTSQHYHIVISDIQMPRLNGIELSKEIFKLNPQQNIIIISAHDDKKYLFELINIGVEAFLEKPISSDGLIKVLSGTCSSFHDKNTLNLGDEFTFNTLTSNLYIKQTRIELSDKEQGLLSLLLENKNQIFSCIDIFNHLYYDDPKKVFSQDSIKSLIKRLRKKVPQGLITNTQQLGYSIKLNS